MNTNSYILKPIGKVENSNGNTQIKIDENYRDGLKQLDKFTHVMVFWWADKPDNDKSRSMLQSEPPYAKGHKTGVFAMRSEYRPNPIAMTVCKLENVDVQNGSVRISKIDAFDGTSVIDMKAYFPVCDKVSSAKIPEYLAGWPDEMPKDGIGLEL